MTDITVDAKDVVVTTPERRAKFFAALAAPPATFPALRDRTRPYAWFGAVLAAYLRIINDKLESMPGADELPDAAFLGFANWLLLRGHDTVQAFLDTPAEPGWQAAYSPEQPPGALPTAEAFWFAADAPPPF
jgi:hypothetical protein